LDTGGEAGERVLKSINRKALALSAAIAVLVAVCSAVSAWVARDLASNLETSAQAGKMLQKHMDADMMHDALRADVLAAAVAHDPRYGISLADVQKSVAVHARQFRDDVAENLGQAHTDVQKQIIGRLKYP